MLVTGIGVFPDSKLATDAKIETQREDGGAILVDETMRTSDKDVYAIGDVVFVVIKASQLNQSTMLKRQPQLPLQPSSIKLRQTCKPLVLV